LQLMRISGSSSTAGQLQAAGILLTSGRASIRTSLLTLRGTPGSALLTAAVIRTPMSCSSVAMAIRTPLQV
jgi:hypothetical protein